MYKISYVYTKGTNLISSVLLVSGILLDGVVLMGAFLDIDLILTKGFSLFLCEKYFFDILLSMVKIFWRS